MATKIRKRAEFPEELSSLVIFNGLERLLGGEAHYMLAQKALHLSKWSFLISYQSWRVLLKIVE